MKTRYIFSILTACLFAACSLDYDPIDTYSDVTEGVSQDSLQAVFKDKAAVLLHRQTLLDLFKNGQEHWYLDMLLLAESHSDNAYAGAPSSETTPFEVNSIEGSNTNLKRDWNAHMSNVAQANKLINYIDDVDDATLTETERQQYKAEAKILRAMVYFDMVRIWGNVPLVLTTAGDITSETIVDVYPAYFPPQTDALTIYQQIETDLLEGLEYAPDNNSQDKTQLSKSVARAMLAKVYAEKPLRDYDKVIQYADELTADGFQLVSDFSDLFGVQLTDPSLPASQTNKAIDAQARNTVETIYEAQYFTGNTNWVTWMFGRELNDWTFYFTWVKWITPSRDLIKAFNSEVGDTRYEQSVVFYQCDWNIYYPADNYAFMYKCRSAYNSIIKLRYADILLLKAEALIGKGEYSAAAAIINQTRNRAGLSNLPSSASASEEAITQAYLKERRLELAFEGQRWFDLVRLDKVEEVMNAVFSKDEGRPAQVYPFTSLSYILPIPQDVIDQNPNLVQNPGY
ncbi:RagB/SusD family nutrient uptake outer membrane protein [Mangrovibacterium diazotrophicum]|uniref:Putative outer membrane starch-binding protein n=1 Tax=Mangrovibacterium diazotrophicum TaxID=1261403 RepID=A0A419W648_9BACT|nr:RagB/SusD family nutrient uptake outer membrane protein [Mangrovibacterium diazotrophicum]RKD90941.1 putative outer membrane starch-binding protein [Mangrovibacterium diazotrophicum]